MAGVGPAQLKAKVQRKRAAQVPVNPTITSGAQSGTEFIVVVKKSYAAPARFPILLKTDAQFRRSGTLERVLTPTSGGIRFFQAATPGVEIMFDGTDNVFPGNQLTAGVTILAEGRTASSNLNDIQLTLTLTQSAGSTPVGPPASVTLTAVSVTLDISPPRPAPGSPFTPLPQPPDPPPAPGAPAADKWFGGATINTQDPANNQSRAELIVGQVFPTAFAGILVLRQVRVSATNTVLGLDNRVQLFDDEIPGPRQTPPVVEAAKSNPLEFNTSAIPNVLGLRFFVEGRNASTSTRDTGFQLGIKNVSDDGDRIALTVAVAPVITVDNSIVVVKKPHTNPMRRVISIRASAPFGRSGTLTRSAGGPPIRLLDQQQPSAGTEIIVSGLGHTFSGSQLSAGVALFAESILPSTMLNDYQLTLTLDSGPAGSVPVGAPATLTLTAVEITLDIGLSRPAPGAQPPLLSAADKINVGRFLQVGDASNNHVRAMMIVRPPNPLVAVALALTPINNRVQTFSSEIPAAGQTPLANPHTILSGIIPPGGTEFFAEGTSVSGAARDTGFSLGIQGLQNGADRVAITTFDLVVANNVAPFATALNRVQIEGVLNRDRASFNLSKLFGKQSDSLFRLRLDIPGVIGNTIQATLTSKPVTGTAIEARNTTLTRTSGNRFVSQPILAIPLAIPRTDITFSTPQNLEVIRSVAAGTIRLETVGTLAGVGVRQVPVRGRVLEMCTVIIQGATPSLNLTTANRVVAQCGIEFRFLAPPTTITNPALLDIQQTACPLTIGGDNSRGTEELALFALGRSTCSANFIIYSVRSNSLGLFGCSAFPVGSPGVTVADTASQYTFCHETCHVLHLPHDTRPNNLMTGSGTNGLPANPANVNLLPDQCQTMNGSGFLVFRQ